MLHLFLLCDLERYKKMNEAIAYAAIKTLSGCMWSLSQVLVGLAFFDTEMKSVMVEALTLQVHNTETVICWKKKLSFLISLLGVLKIREEQKQFLLQVIEKQCHDCESLQIHVYCNSYRVSKDLRCYIFRHTRQLIGLNK